MIQPQILIPSESIKEITTLITCTAVTSVSASSLKIAARNPMIKQKEITATLLVAKIVRVSVNANIVFLSVERHYSSFPL